MSKYKIAPFVRLCGAALYSLGQGRTNHLLFLHFLHVGAKLESVFSYTIEQIMINNQNAPKTYAKRFYILRRFL